MNKKQFIVTVAEKTEMTQKDVDKVLGAFLETIEESLAEGKKVQFVGFGSFEKVRRKSREGRNPQNPGEVIQIPAKNAIRFRAGKGFKDAVEASPAPETK